jgi:hypothetical protein
MACQPSKRRAPAVFWQGSARLPSVSLQPHHFGSLSPLISLNLGAMDNGNCPMRIGQDVIGQGLTRQLKTLILNTG